MKAVVVCATDKVYENKEWIWGYRENDELGGYDPYSTGKAMAELAVMSYRRSFFSGEGSASKRRVALGSVRAGNVIGGGDFTENGLLADCMKSILKSKSIFLRNPSSLDPGSTFGNLKRLSFPGGKTTDGGDTSPRLGIYVLCSIRPLPHWRWSRS